MLPLGSALARKNPSDKVPLGSARLTTPAWMSWLGNKNSRFGPWLTVELYSTSFGTNAIQYKRKVNGALKIIMEKY